MSTKQILKVERIHITEGDGPTKAFVDLLILDSFVVKGIRIIKGTDGLFCSMPSEQGTDGKWYDTFYPISEVTRKGLQALILDEYNKDSDWDGEANNVNRK